jgi:putrescine aminotransferase
MSSLVLNRAGISEQTVRHLAPHRVATFKKFGVDIVMGERQGYRFRNLDGDWLYDLHLNGGTYNLGHRHPELLETLSTAIKTYDVGNHHFSSGARVAAAEALLSTQGFDAKYVVFSTSGSEAIDMAVKAARRATGHKKVISIDHGYHGRSGISGAAGDNAAARYFLSEDKENFLTVPFNDTLAVQALLASNDIACVLLETIPATYGFPEPKPDYHRQVREACTQAGTLLIADEVQTGLGRTGSWWAIERFGAKPDMLVTSKGLGGGLYPMAATMFSSATGNWLEENGWAYVSTFGGSELGCLISEKVIEITSRETTWTSVDQVARKIGNGLREIMSRNDYVIEVRQSGLVMGLKFDHPQGSLHAMKALIDQGVWAIFAGFDMSILQFKPGLLLTADECDDILTRVDSGLRQAAKRRNESLIE